jgi:hypothetical protein
MKMIKVTIYAMTLAIFEKALTVAALANEPDVSFGGFVRNRSQPFLSSSLMLKKMGNENVKCQTIVRSR